MRIVLFTGKGGVGKTTTACAAALRLADLGHKTLLLSTDPAHSLADALATPLGPEPTEVAHGLSAVQLDSQRELERAWRQVQGYLLDVLSRGGVDPVTADELTVLPGIEEVLALLAVREWAAAGSWDRLVVDCAPTAETLRLLALPEALGWYLRKALPLHRRFARGMRPLAALLGRGEAVPADAVFEAVLRLADDLAAVRRLLGDPAITTVRLVLTPEAVVVAEARRTLTALALYGYAVDEVVANRVFPGADGDPWRAGWARAQRAQLAAVGESFGDLPVREVPYLPDEPVGTAALRELAAAVYGDGDPLGDATPGDLLTVRPSGSEYVLSLRLPLVTRDQLALARVEDELVVTVADRRRVITLPSLLRRCAVVGAAVTPTGVDVRFRADPAQWPEEWLDRPEPAP